MCQCLLSHFLIYLDYGENVEVIMIFESLLERGLGANKLFLSTLFTFSKLLLITLSSLPLAPKRLHVLCFFMK